ncbi:MAG TPA: imidazole glycerol phosphate synthase subunit HisH [Solirubrobacteraceae bacterium]|jgi:glutamine amidotransferase|nr:imidazole glycerol phosphate synthase subunit HisH [Solirubrobacteraceae bacterium]
MTTAGDTDADARRLIDEPVEIAVVDYGMGNRRSVEKALEHIGASVTISSDHERLRMAAGLVVPGVGAFPRGMANLRELGLDELLRERLAHGTPVLGICLGMQLAFERSTEQGGAQGLGVIAGEVRRLPRSGTPSGAQAGEQGELKLPHIGWNKVSLTARSPLTEGLPERCAFYHVHSFAPVPSAPEDILGTAVYGAPFASVVGHESFYGVQFHPEKSSAAGLRLLANFARICAHAAVPAVS